MLKRPSACGLKVLASLLVTFMCTLPVFEAACGQQEGVKTGDWVKYKISRKGSAGIDPKYDDAEWVKTEIRENLGQVTVLETIHYFYGLEAQETFTGTLGLGGTALIWVIPANAHAGVEITLGYYGNFQINTTVSKTYGVTSRLANQLNFSFLHSFYPYEEYYFWEFLWDMETGLLLTWTRETQTHFVGYENITRRSLTFEIDDTNAWDFKSSAPITWNQLGLILLVLLATATSAFIYRKLRRNGILRKREKSRDKSQLSHLFLPHLREVFPRFRVVFLASFLTCGKP